MSSSTTLTSTSQTLPHGHLDYVLDISFDHYGRRFATASGDRTVRVWDLTAEGVWETSTTTPGGGGGSSNNNEWQAHKGPVYRLSWAHPEFGQLLATAGSDHSVIIWEEREGGFNSLATPERSADGFFEPAPNTRSNSNDDVVPAAAAATTTTVGMSRWVAKATLSDARRAVTAVEFAPRHLGLRLASGSSDGIVRIYEALDIMNLNHWKLDAEMEENVDNSSSVGGGGGEDSGSGPGGSSNNNTTASSNENMGVSSLSWCTGRFEPATLVIGYASGRVSICRYDDGRRTWMELLRLPGHLTSDGIPRGVLDVAWAPNVGRTFHLIASCGKDNRLLVHRIKRVGGGDGEDDDDDDGKNSSGLTYEDTALLDQERTNWRCQWNVTGTVLASSGDGGAVMLWKNDFHGNWKCVSDIVGDTKAASSA